MKLHVSMNVPDLKDAIRFYSNLFATEPMIVRENYAKWDVENPAVNFVVESGRENTGFDHIGIQVSDEEELEQLTTRMENTGNPYLGVEKTTCCYAKMEKAWVRGEANEPWEGFLTHAHDSEEYGTDREGILPDRHQVTADQKPCC
ncbi:MAG: glyoxalase/bleomycin resistance/dioxygenase family protein [Granulosicoccus sp.]|nr:glyoxalase/bleomycin resistance/dioxygenase family protein [Granulosicoccus sp.]